MSSSISLARGDELLAVFPEPAREALWLWLEDRTTVDEHLQLSPTATVPTLEATLGTIQRGVYEQSAASMSNLCRSSCSE